MFHKIKKLGVLAVGGGNDSVSSLWLLAELRKVGLNPQHIDIICMLPENVQYTNTVNTNIPRLVQITQQTARAIDGTLIKKLPEAILAGALSQFNINRLFGAHLSSGSNGLATTLKVLLDTEKYDLLLAVDVGGDFIAHRDNLKVLSPMMDAYAAFALQQIQTQSSTRILGAVFGLGFDGESTPQLLEEALDQVRSHAQIRFTSAHQEVTNFYLEQVRPNRRSQTGDLMTDALSQQLKSEYEVVRPFHVRSLSGTKKHLATQKFQPHTKRALDIHLFNDISRIQNRFIVPCSSGLEWERQIRDGSHRFNHELCGQILNNTYIGTPSWLFDEVRTPILEDIQAALKNQLYPNIVTYAQDFPAP